MKVWIFGMLVMLVVNLNTNAQAPAPGENSVQRELVELRAELKGMRADIQALMQTLKADADGQVLPVEPKELAPVPAQPVLDPAANHMVMPSRAENPGREPRLEIEERPYVELTLEQCIEMALKNVDKTAKANAKVTTNSELTYATKIAFWQLWAVHHEWKFNMQQHISALALLENARGDKHSSHAVVSQLQAWASDTSPTAKTHRHSRHANIGEALHELENQLRQQIGWAQLSRGQPNIKPVVAHVELKPWPESWNTTLQRALKDNAELLSVREKHAALKSQLSEAKGQPGYDKLALESVKLAEIKWQRMQQLTDEVSFSWRLLDSQREQIRVSREQFFANAEEVRIYRERMLEATADQMQTVGLLRRASERLNQVAYQYWMSVAEYQKCYAQLEFHCGQN